jgi:hypothetical protein
MEETVTMNEFVTMVQGAGGGVLAGGIAWLLFWKSAQRNEKLVDDRMQALEKAVEVCEKDRQELHTQFHTFQNHLIEHHGAALKDVADLLRQFK